MRRIALFSLLVCAACAQAGSSARLLHVAEGGGGDGSSWAAASGSLQDVLQSAHPGDEVWVASGRYAPGAPGAERTATFLLPEGVTLRGGFAGFETSLAERDPDNAPSILDGDLAGDDGPGFSGRADNCYHVLTAHMLESALLENFTVRGGQADGPALGPHVESGDQGSGMTVFHAHPHVVGCLFVDNWAQNHGTVNDHGGGTYADCTFAGNHAELLGAGLYFHGDVEAHATHCTFLGNHTPGQGGGAYSRSSLGSSFEDCTFIGNGAERGAGLYLAEGNATDVLQGTFVGNIADIGGGGLYIDVGTGLVADCTFTDNAAGHDVQDGGAGAGGSGGGGLWSSFGAPRIEDCLFDSNTASFGAGVYLSDGSQAIVRRCDFLGGLAFEAGGYYALHSPGVVEDCLFLDNRAQGGAFSVGGGMSVYFSAASVRHCRFVGNAAELGGGGLYSEGESPSFDRCEFVGNSALGLVQGWGGGYMAGYFTQARLSNCSFQGNRANQGGAVFAIAFAAPTLVQASFAGNSALLQGGGLAFSVLASAHVQNSILWGDLPEELSGDGAILEHVCLQDPLFLVPPQAGPDGEWGTDDDLHGNLRLAPGSPCRDAGDNSFLLAGEELDLDGSPRIVDDPALPDTGVGGPPTVDLGAYEAGPGT
jgi:hypothetical protein